VLTALGCVISCYTCLLIIDVTGEDNEFMDALYKYFGKKGWYAGLISTTCVVCGAYIVMFVILAQLLYPLSKAVLAWSTGTESVVLLLNPTFKEFSSAYTALFLFGVELIIVNRRNIQFFIKIISFGAAFIIALILIFAALGLYGLSTTSYEFSNAPVEEEWDSNLRHLSLVTSNFQPLLGMMCIGFFLHTVSIPIIKNNEKQENNSRDVVWAYLLVFISNSVFGALGYIGLKGVYFNPYYSLHPTNPVISQVKFIQDKNTELPQHVRRHKSHLFHRETHGVLPPFLHSPSHPSLP